MPDDRKKPTGAEENGDDGFRVDVPDDLLEEAVSAVDRRVAQSKAKVNTGLDDEPEMPEMPAEISVDMSVDVESSATEAETEAPDIEQMSVDELLNSGFLPDKIVGAFLEERTKAAEMKKQADATREKLAAFQAESENFRKRVTREKDDAIKFANEKVLKEFLPVVDNLERALAHAGAELSGSIREGVEITLRQANHVLEKLGVTRVGATIGSPFDPRFHEAVSQQENKDIPVNSIAMVMQAGFLLHDRLLRPAMVAVAKGGSAQQPTPQAAQAKSPDAPATPPTPATPVTPGQETPEQRLERIRRAGQAAREQRIKKREADEAKAAAKPAEAPKETPEERADRLRKTGQAAREARIARKKEAARAKEAEQNANAAPAPSAAETPEEKLERIRKTGKAAREAREAKRRERDRGDAQSIAAAEEKAAKAETKGETPEQKLERIRKTGEAAREARRKKRAEAEAKDAAAAAALEEEEAVAEAEAGEAKAAPARTETPEEKLARIRKTGQAAREARRKRREEGSAAKPANPLAGPAFEDDDLDSWETTVDSIRTDKS